MNGLSDGIDKILKITNREKKKVQAIILFVIGLVYEKGFPYLCKNKLSAIIVVV